MACASTSERQPPSTLTVSEAVSVETANGKEFIFCDPTGGPWACIQPTRKTPINSPIVKYEDTKEKVLPVEKPMDTYVPPQTVEPPYRYVPPQRYVQKEKPIPRVLPEYSVWQGIGGKDPDAIVYFDFDSSELDQNAKSVLIDLMLEHKKGRVVFDGYTLSMHGYTDNVGTENYNENLAQYRVDAVMAYWNNWVSKNAKLEGFAHGRCCYISPNGTDEQRAKNRRVEIYLTKPVLTEAGAKPASVEKQGK